MSLNMVAGHTIDFSNPAGWTGPDEEYMIYPCECDGFIVKEYLVASDHLQDRYDLHVHDFRAWRANVRAARIRSLCDPADHSAINRYPNHGETVLLGSWVYTVEMPTYPMVSGGDVPITLRLVPSGERISKLCTNDGRIY